MRACSVTSVASSSLWPHGWQPTRLLCLWDSPGKSTGVGCHCLLQCIKVKKSEVAQSCPTLSDPMDRSLPGSSVHGIFQARVLEWVAIAFSDINARLLDWFSWMVIFITVCCFNCSILLAIVNLVLCVIYKLNFVIAMYVISQLVKNPPVRQKTLVWFLGWEALLDKG